MVTSIFAAGMKLGDKQGLRFAESIKFAEALQCEFDIMVRTERMSYEDAEEYLNFMWNFNIVEKEEPKDDFIVGEVCKAGLFPTDIVSKESLPSHFYGKKVEIRLKEIAEVVEEPEDAEVYCRLKCNINQPEGCVFYLEGTGGVGVRNGNCKYLEEVVDAHIKSLREIIK